jgi:hypothetical protein
MRQLFDIPQIISRQSALWLISQFFNASRKNLFCFEASIGAHRNEKSYFVPRRKLTARKPGTRSFIKSAKCLHSFIKSANHFIRPELVCGNGSNRHLKFFNHVNSRCQACFHEVLILRSKTQNYLIADLRELGVRTIQYSANSISSPQKRSLISIYQKLGRMFVLTFHNKNCNQQRGYRANCLHPCCPIRFSKFAVKASHDECRASAEREQWVPDHPRFEMVDCNCHKEILA